ncbi:MFS transporter [Flavihumibacter petaseus]|uniref:Putative glucose/galactose transporter n=1 Tax=Flavihumibacter petaseus NBRC 106054 TaxID=1220578 RepID=A0A0E9N6I9_9BACT|nr:MFS transporter [Flavihumibacter petaseus]GAO45341.1 putative glucose/galactose transporter [Flavihumibacter petaseus NBRC 106054]
MSQSKQPTNTGALATLVIVFFFWGFIAASNSIFIPFCKTHFGLNQFQSQLIGSAFYGAYFIGSLALFIASNLLGYDILNRIGYKKGIIYGLWISVVGALLIIPSAHANSFPAILGSFFVIALGFSLQQTAAQPFAISLGDPSTGSHRLNLAGGVNSLGTTLGPIIVSLFLFGSVGGEHTEVTVTNVNNLYMIVAGVFAAVALFFAFSKLPDGKNDEKFEKASKASRSLLMMTGAIGALIVLGQLTEVDKLYLLLISIIAVVGILFWSNGEAGRKPEGWGAMQYQQLIYGMIGIFVYVGVEVTIDNNFGALLKSPGYLTELGLDESKISKYVSLYWGSLMIGRWTGAIGVFNLSETGKKIATIVVPFIAFAIILLVNRAYGNDISDLYGYAACIVLAILAFFYGQQKPVKTLLTVALLATIAMLVGVFSKGIVSVYALMAGGLCCSVMWPCIFSLGVAGLGKYTSQGSAFLVMMILGGAVIPPLQGTLGDMGAIGFHKSYLLAALCFAFLAYLAVKFRSVLKAQGLDFDSQVGGGH